MHDNIDTRWNLIDYGNLNSTAKEIHTRKYKDKIIIF